MSWRINGLSAQDDPTLRSQDSNFPIQVRWHNKIPKPVKIIWMNYEGKPVDKNEVLAPDAQLKGTTGLGHLFKVQGEGLNLMFLVSPWTTEFQRVKPGDEQFFRIDDEDLDEHFEYEYRREQESVLFRCLSGRYVLTGTAWKQTHQEPDGTETVTLYAEVARTPDVVILHDPIAKQTVMIGDEGMYHVNNDQALTRVKVADGEWNIPK